MIKEYLVKITPQAQGQIQEIMQYITNELKATESARQLLNALEDAITSLSRFPERIALTKEEPWHSNGIHKMLVKNFYIYFWIDENNCKVQVIAVIYKKRDQEKQFIQKILNKL